MCADAPGGQVEFRKTLAMSFFYKFVVYVSDQLAKINSNLCLPDRLKSCIREIERPISSGKQYTDESCEIVGKSLSHVSAVKHTTGEAVYIDDMPKIHNELYAAIVGSSHANARIT